jgi:spermidine/putrescine transport system permease protein
VSVSTPVEPAPAPAPARGRRRRAPDGRRRTLGLFAAPGVLWLIALVVIPYAGVLVFSFWKTDYIELIPAFTFSSLERAVTDETVREVALRTLWISLSVTALTFVIALPLAYFAAFYARRKQLFIFCLIAPMFVSYIVRLYSWRLLLGDEGVVNRVLDSLGIIREPLSFLLFSPWAVILTLTYVYLPFMIISLFTVLDGMDRRVLQAAGDLYASPVRRFVAVTLPQLKPGIAAGIMFVFPLSFGDYIAPQLVGGTRGQMFANLVQNQFGTTFDYPFGAALALLLLILVMLVVWGLERWRGAQEVRAF